ncbi:HD-GYP domain-containing protein [Psychromonas antarctica]|uniref:HD-GYP domain-containing protein n=1 Tax=Psychromonas antarctica TaxID=67573 RepID=UPI001EE81B0A|nr:HD domain-containing phosphohydrolase [Psychromonas antarctica]MCG6202609.1 HD domain-containing protein [Psychromonas antarctica]
MDGIPVKKNELVIGKAIPWSVYDHNEALLLRKGFIIHSKRQLDRLLDSGLMRKGNPSRDNSQEFATSPHKKVSIFEVEDFLLQRLDRAYCIGFKGKKSPLFISEIIAIAKSIQVVSEEAPAATLGAMQLSLGTNYGLIHPLHAAVICEMIAKKKGVSDISRLSLLAAALTHDIGYYELQGELVNQISPVTPEQKKQIVNHSICSEQLLIALGVKDKTWLDVVRHHHERLDGSGYPDRLKGLQISMPARILMAADIYSAMIRPKKYRSGRDIQEALNILFSAREKEIDSSVVQVLISELGLYPPGCLVQLYNSEIAVVRGQTKERNVPDIMCVVSQQGGALARPLPRTIDTGEYRIVGHVSSSEYKWLKVSLNTLWPKLKPNSVITR